jgi:hypothetical protein
MPWEIECYGSCVDPNSDPWNCGACDNACGWTEDCCDGWCTDVYYDDYNCGACGYACAWDEICDGGWCVAY